MAGEWKEVLVSEIAPFAYGKGLPDSKRNPNGNIPVYGSNGIVGLHDVPLTNGPTVVIGRKGTVGAVHYSPVPCWPIDTTFFVTGTDSLLVRYRYYFLKSLGLDQMNSDSAVPGLNRDAAHNRMARIPSNENEQRAIAHILGTLDDKIELNRRMNQTLEEMARAIFKSWFVDFLPVRAKMAAKQQDQSLLLPQVEPDTWFVYALECDDGSLYIGQTEDLRQRWLQHTSGKGGRWTNAHPPQRLVYWERQPSREAAVEREKWLKTGFGRKWLKKEIAAIARTQTGDPVRAKAAVRREHPTWTNEQVSRAACPTLKPDIAALFPDAFEDSELGEIPKGWRVGRLGDIVQIHDSTRIPLSSRERAKRQGPYRYYGAAGIVDYVDDFLFDGTYVLVGEDGSVVTDSGNPVVQYVWGKFWVNNHAHVLKASGGFSDEHLLLVLQQVYVVPFVTGAVQPKLSQTNMNAIPIIWAEPEVNTAFNKLIEPIFAKVRALHDEVGLLADIRDTLLPKLISGELRVPDAERIAGRYV